jgi:hypothetical protein
VITIKVIATLWKQNALAWDGGGFAFRWLLTLRQMRSGFRKHSRPAIKHKVIA